MKHKCIICGKEALRTVEIGDISIHLCGTTPCTALFNYKVNGSFPMVWLCPTDSVEHNDTSERIAEYFEEHPEKFLLILDSVTDGLWDYENFGETFSELTEAAATDMERGLAEEIPLDEIPIFIEHFKNSEAREYLKQRLRDGK